MNSIDIENLICPISLCVFYDPVIAEDGFTYERESILRILNSTNISPMTNQTFKSANLISNKAMKSLCCEFLSKNPHMQKDVYIPEITIEFVKTDDFKRYCESPNFDIKCILNDAIIQALCFTQLEYIILHNTREQLETQGYECNRLLHYICKHKKSLPLLKLLLDKKVDIEAENVNKARAVHFICRFWKNISALQYIMDKGADMNAENYNKWRPIHLICYDWRNSLDVIRLLKVRNVDMNIPLDNGWRPIHFICRYWHKTYGEEALKLMDKTDYETEDHLKPSDLISIYWKKDDDQHQYS